MSFLDMIGMSAGNLWRRKLRTALTVLGVLIGTASIVAMLSLAIGMRSQLMAEFDSYGSATQITVYSGEGGEAEQSADMMLTDTNVEMFEGMDYVEKVMPQLDMDGQIPSGRYEGYAYIRGVDQSILEEQEVEQGTIPDANGGGGKIPVLVGNTVITNFYPMSGDEGGYYETGELPDVDLMKDVKTLECYDYTSAEEEEPVEETDTDETEGDATEESDTEDMMTTEDDYSFTIRLDPTGVMAGGPDSYSNYSECLLTNIDVLKDYLMHTYGKGKIPGQPKIDGRPLNEWVYSTLIVEVDETEHVAEVQQQLQDLGFDASSNQEMLDSIQETMRIVELVLGGIGMVAFLVAAIGIANTMMMSTYERTKEIGVMKVLGCDMKDIRRLFLSEAAFIGFIGGVVGLGFSLLISKGINYVAAASGEMTGSISLVPWWLGLIAIGFSTLMGTLAGYFPARRAMKLSPLAAIRTE